MQNEERDRDCELDRRGFLRSCSLIAAAALAAGATGASAQSAGFQWIQAVSGGRGNHLTYALPGADGVSVDRDNAVLLTRYNGQVYAFSMICPHQRAAVKWLEDKGIFQCTKHKSRYTEDGSYVSGRATRSLDRHPIQLSGGQLSVDSEVLLREDRDAAAWKAAVVHV